MSNEGRGGKSDPVDDVRKGLGFLFRAARTAVERMHSGKVEEVVVSGAKEVGRAFENVASTLEREIFGQTKPGGDIPKPPSPPEVHGDEARVEPATGEQAKAPEASGENPEHGPHGHS